MIIFLVAFVTISLMIFLTGLYVAAEFATVSARRTKISQLAAQNDSLARMLLPIMARLVEASQHTHRLWEYYWDTIDQCVPHATILAALRQTGFVDVEHRMFGGCLSEYLARKPSAAGASR